MASKVIPSSKGKKGGTESRRNFSYKSFSTKIQNLKIDPIRRVRRYVDDETSDKSYFQTSFENWTELNLSTVFCQFAYECRPLSESLPLIIHHKDKIFDLLCTYIDKRDPHALEPLLDLLAQFTHDLGVTFEPYLERAVTLLASLVAKHVDFQVVEWTFNCLAYILKYLSRLLAPDLRPLYDILAPQLGRQHQKAFVIKFAAEALSFLVRKATGESLLLIVRYAFEDFKKNLDNPKAAAYSRGLLTMFYEACIGVDKSIHSRGPSVLKAMGKVAAENPNPAVDGIIQGVLIALVHHTGHETFAPVIEAVVEMATGLMSPEAPSPRDIEMAARMLYTCISVRKGSRIGSANWQSVGDVTSQVLEVASKLMSDEQEAKDAMWMALKASTVLMEYGDLDVVISRCARTAERAKEWQEGCLFVPYCEFVAGLGEERFTQFVLPSLQRYMQSQWESQETLLCLLAPKLAEQGQLRAKESDEIIKPGSFVHKRAQALFTSMISVLEGSSIDQDLDELLLRSWRYLDVLTACCPAQQISRLEAFYQPMVTIISSIATGAENRKLAPIAGKALSLLSQLDKVKKERTTKLPSSTLRTLIERFHSNTAFLAGVLSYIKTAGIELFSIDEQKQISDSLRSNLASPSHETRRASISILEIFSKYWNAKSDDASETLRTMGLIEDTPFLISNQRNLAMYVRKLGMEYAHIPRDSPERQLVPWYCFGLMTIKFSPLWEDASKALALIVETDEQIVTDLAFKWLSGDGLSDSGDHERDDMTSAPGLTPFQCSNLLSIEKAADGCVFDEFGAVAELGEMFNKNATFEEISASKARSSALQILCEIPQVAEKRSRVLIPMFLEWSTHTVQEDEEDEELGPEPESTTPRWSRRDQTAMLTLLAKFVNPRSLYKSEAVYASLLNLVASGDSKVQAMALKCVLTWKTPAIKAYKDRLNNILDDTLFRDELTNFVKVDEDDSSIESTHRHEVMQVLLRLLYGRCLSRKNATSGRKGMASTRAAILSALASLRTEERAMFVEIALGELAHTDFIDRSDPKQIKFKTSQIGSVHFSLRKQVGLVRMVEDLLKQLGTTLISHLGPMLDGVLYCLVSTTETSKAAEEADQNPHTQKALKAVRVGGFKCLNSMINHCPTFDWRSYMPAIFASLVERRLEKLPVESSQGVSGILQLFSSFTNSKHTILFLSEFNPQIISKIGDALVVDSIKDEVVVFIVQILKRVVQMANNIDESVEETALAVKENILKPNVDQLLARLSTILRKSLSKEVLEQCIETVADLAPFVSSTTETTQLVQISVFLLDQPTRRVNPKIKSDILRILVNALPNCVMEKGDELYESVFRTISGLFGFFKDRDSRMRLASVLEVFASRDAELVEIAKLSQQLNSFSGKRLDEPDFQQRLQAFAAINEDRYKVFNAKQWTPLIHNMFFFIKDNEELAIRTNASYTLKRFAEICGTLINEPTGAPFISILTTTLLPVLRSGTHEQSELIRQEYVAVFAHIVKHIPTLEETKDLSPLLVDDDEEASFFNNILHIQAHRRLRALRRLAKVAKSHTMNPDNVGKFFLPLIEHFIFDPVDEGHALAHEAVMTVGALTGQCTWSMAKALWRRYTGYIKSKSDMARVVIRLVGVVVNGLVGACGMPDEEEDEVEEELEEDTEKLKELTVEEKEDVDIEMTAPKEEFVCRLGESVPEREKLAEEISKNFLPVLSEYLHKKDDATVSLRVPVAISIVKLLRVMPEEMMKVKLPAVLTDLSHILRSRAQDDRDMTRKTLSEIALLLGPQYFSFILKEMRGSLQRGYQKHVLSYTVHHILVTMVPKLEPGALDYCVPAITDIIMDDIFGVTGAEKDAEGYINKMKEVKSSKSYDSMDILASITTLPFLGQLVRPIRSLLLERMNLKMVTKIDELLRRITVGLLRNGTVKDRNLLVFCYEIVQDVYKTYESKPIESKVDEKRKRFLINLKAPSKGLSTVATSSHVFKLIKFSLDILRTLLAKHDKLMTPENMAGFIPIIGDSILSKQEEVQISAIRLLTTIIRVPLADIDTGAEVFVSKALSLIKSCPSTNSELAQASLKLIGAILRERKTVPVKETTIGYLLTRVKPDLEEPHLQGVTFNFLKAVLSRKFAIPEAYEIMDEVAAIMVTNQTRSVRDLCRGLYFQFLMDYPQSEKRWKKQLAFMVKNLEYKHEAGRKSILEAMHLVVTKMGDNIIQEICATFFVPLVMILVNDDSTDCREMTGALLKDVFKRADEERRDVFLQLLKSWVLQDQNDLLTRVALQCYSLYFEVVGAAGEAAIKPLLPHLRDLLVNAVDDDAENPTEWEITYFSLQLWSKFSTLFPALTMNAKSADMWLAVRGCLRFPHAWVRLTSSRLLGVLFADYTKADLTKLPLDNGRGLKLTGEDMTAVAYATSSQLNSPELTEEVGMQVTKNLLFLARCFYANKMVSTAALPTHDKDLDDLEEEAPTKSALLWLVGRMSGVIRSERNIKKGLINKNCAMQFLAALISIMSADDVRPITALLIAPMYNLTELPDGHTMKALKNTALEILEMLQNKVGTTDYAAAYSEVRQAVAEKRLARRHKRKIEAVVEPEKAAVRKTRKHERKREVRKEKSGVMKEWRRGKML